MPPPWSVNQGDVGTFQRFTVYIYVYLLLYVYFQCNEGDLYGVAASYDPQVTKGVHTDGAVASDDIESNGGRLVTSITIISNTPEYSALFSSVFGIYLSSSYP